MSARKYRQKGYQDEEPRERAREGRPQGRRDEPERPRGRGLGAPTTSVFRCSACGHPRSLSEPVGVDTVCSQCGADLHACVNCLHFDTSSPHECRKPIPRPVLKKATRNDCALFEPKLAQEREERARPADPRAAFDDLFK